MDYYNFIGFLFYGLVAGILARTIFPGEDKGGLLVTSLLGVVGSMMGGWVFNLFGWTYAKGLSLKGMLPALCGALIILTLYKCAEHFLKTRLSK
jgi:uncharacterized membrane protein YeaQ/YmgE (transglycosylase-associated protein family)